MYELIFFLVSAYSHDIGMTPQQRKVNERDQLLLDGSAEATSQQERFPNNGDHIAVKLRPRTVPLQ